MKAKLAKKLVSSLAASAVLVSVFAACDLGLTPYVATTDAGPEIIVDSGNNAVDTGTVDAGSDAGDAGDASTGPKRVFVTSQKFFGDFNGQHGQAGADAICVSLATAAKLNNTRFVAWISETNKNAIDHLTEVGPWYLVDRKTLVFASKAAIVALPQHAIDHDETGAQVGGVFGIDPGNVWTGTTYLGQAFPSADCAEWTQGNATNVLGLVGDPTVAMSSDWTQNQNLSVNMNSCARSNRIYCFEQ